jgi:hypothetical protein
VGAALALACAVLGRAGCVCVRACAWRVMLCLCPVPLRSWLSAECSSCCRLLLLVCGPAAVAASAAGPTAAWLTLPHSCARTRRS